jgi:hypothetical protein
MQKSNIDANRQDLSAHAVEECQDNGKACKSLKKGGNGCWRT